MCFCSLKNDRFGEWAFGQVFRFEQLFYVLSTCSLYHTLIRKAFDNSVCCCPHFDLSDPCNAPSHAVAQVGSEDEGCAYARPSGARACGGIAQALAWGMRRDLMVNVHIDDYSRSPCRCVFGSMSWSTQRKRCAGVLWGNFVESEVFHPQPPHHPQGGLRGTKQDLPIQGARHDGPRPMAGGPSSMVPPRRFLRRWYLRTHRQWPTARDPRRWPVAELPSTKVLRSDGHR